MQVLEAFEGTMLLTISVITSLLFCNGCMTSGVTFHVVDESGKPLAGVCATEQGGRLYFGGGGGSSHATYAPTDATGVVTSRDIRRDWGYIWVFSMPGYQQTQVSISEDEMVEVFSPMKSPKIDRIVPRVPFVVVPMQMTSRKEK